MPPTLELLVLVRDAANRYELWSEIVCAVIEQESAWDPWALRYEPAFYQRYVQPQVSRGSINNETEARARAFSWGLMQVMGQVAREHGFAARSLTELCEPATGLDVGCRVLTAKLAAAKGNMVRALLLWNGGGNRDYPAAVMARAAHYAVVPQISSLMKSTR